MTAKWRRFTEPDNPWSYEPAEGWRSKNWEILFRPGRPESGLARARYMTPSGSVPHSYFLVYDIGHIGWDRPEAVPKYVREKVHALVQAQAGSMRGFAGFGAQKVKLDECYSPGVLVNLYALMEAEAHIAPLFFSGWSREETVEGRGGVPWVFFRVPYRERSADQPYSWAQEEARKKAMADQARAARDWLTKKMKVPAVLWCGEWGPPRAPDAPPPKGKKVKPHKAFDRAVRELKSTIKARADDIRETLDEIEEEEKRMAEEEGWEAGYDEYPSFVGCLDPTTGVVYEAGIEWPQYFRGCGGPGPWNEIVAFYLDLEDPRDMLEAASDVVAEAFDMAGAYY